MEKRGERLTVLFQFLLMTVRKCPQPPALSDGVGAVTCRLVGWLGRGRDTVVTVVLTHSLDSWDVRLPFLPGRNRELLSSLARPLSLITNHHHHSLLSEVSNLKFQFIPVQPL